MTFRHSSSSRKAATARFKQEVGYSIVQNPPVSVLKEWRNQYVTIVAQAIVWMSLVLSGLGLIKLLYVSNGAPMSASAMVMSLLLALNASANFLRWKWYVGWIRQWPVVSWVVGLVIDGRIRQAEADARLLDAYVSLCSLEERYHQLVKRFNEANQSRARQPASVEIANGTSSGNVLVVNFPKSNHD